MQPLCHLPLVNSGFCHVIRIIIWFETLSQEPEIFKQLDPIYTQIQVEDGPG